MFKSLFKPKPLHVRAIRHLRAHPALLFSVLAGVWVAKVLVVGILIALFF